MWRALERRALRASWLFRLAGRYWLLSLDPERREALVRAKLARRMEYLSRSPVWAPLLDGWCPVPLGTLRKRSANEGAPSFFALSAQGEGSPFYNAKLLFIMRRCAPIRSG